MKYAAIDGELNSAIDVGRVNVEPIDDYLLTPPLQIVKLKVRFRHGVEPAVFPLPDESFIDGKECDHGQSE